MTTSEAHKPMSAAPPNHLTWAILSLLFGCWPLGIPAIVYASQVNEKWIAGDRRGVAELRQHLKYWPGWIRHNAIPWDTR